MWGPIKRQSWGPRVRSPCRASTWSTGLMSWLETEARSRACGTYTEHLTSRGGSGRGCRWGEGEGTREEAGCQQREKKVRWGQQRPRRGRSTTGLAAPGGHG